MSEQEEHAQQTRGSQGTSTETTPDQAHKPHVISFTVDGDEFSTEEKSLTVRQILALADLDSTRYYLVEINGQQQKPLTDLDGQVHLHEGMKFVSVSTGPTNVS